MIILIMMFQATQPTVFVTSLSWSSPLSTPQRLQIETQLPSFFLKDNSHYLRWQDRQNRLLSRWLLLRQLKKLQALPSSGLNSWTQRASGKPFLPSSLPFSISHTDGLVAIAVSSIEVGIDVENIVIEENWNIFSNIFNPKEEDFIEKTSSQNESFTTLWTRKEAILKAGGWGLRDNMAELNTLKNPTVFDDSLWFWKPLNLPNPYVGHVACPQPFLLQHEHLTQNLDSLKE